LSRLVALQYDQIDGIEDTQSPAAVELNATQNTEERRAAWESVRRDEPSRLPVPRAAREGPRGGRVGRLAVRRRRGSLRLSLGHDFRADYLRLASVIERPGHPPFVALTATASLPVRRDMTERLGLATIATSSRFRPAHSPTTRTNAPPSWPTSAP
jgi:ATP-dependent DNA helicase RecQ